MSATKLEEKIYTPIEPIIFLAPKGCVYGKQKQLPYARSHCASNKLTIAEVIFVN